MNQEAINLNVQERLRSLEAAQSIMSAFLFAVAETHPDPAHLRDQFVKRSEMLIAGMLARELAEDYIDSAASYREALLAACAPPSP